MGLFTKPVNLNRMYVDKYGNLLVPISTSTPVSRSEYQRMTKKVKYIGSILSDGVIGSNVIVASGDNVIIHDKTEFKNKIVVCINIKHDTYNICMVPVAEFNNGSVEKVIGYTKDNTPYTETTLNEFINYNNGVKL